MNLWKKVTAGSLSLILAAGLASGTMAQDATGNVDVVIAPSETGVMSVAITNVNFGSYEYSLSTQSAREGSVVISTGDTRGTAEGWSVTLSGTDFDPNFLIGNLTLTDPQVATTSGTGLPSEDPPAAVAANPVVVAPGTTVITAAPDSGAGTCTTTYDANLTIPGGTLVGTYQSTLTVTITGAGPEE